MPMFKDPATIKFVAKKFVMSTNDVDNPISVVRQIHKDDTGKIEIFLTNGKSYTDEIDTLSDLISITSNKAFLVTIKLSSQLTISFDHKLSEKDLKAQVLAAFTNYIRFDPEINPKYYFEPNKMFPRRVIPKSVSTNLKGHTRFQEYRSNQEAFFAGITTFSFYVICPEDHIYDLEDSLEEIICQRFRHLLDGRGVAVYSGRNLEGQCIDEVEMEEALSFPDTWTMTIGASLNDKQGLISNNESTASDVLNDFIDLVVKEIKVEREEK